MQVFLVKLINVGTFLNIQPMISWLLTFILHYMHTQSDTTPYIPSSIDMYTFLVIKVN